MKIGNWKFRNPGYAQHQSSDTTGHGTCASVPLSKTRFGAGYILLFALVFFSVFISIAIAFLGSVTTFAKSGRAYIAEAQARSLAEAGFDKAVYELNESGSYAGESNTALGSGTFTVSVASVDTSTKRITSTGSVSGRTAVVRANVSIDTSVVSFNYGVQVGQGGLSMSNSSRVVGNVHSAGSILMANGSSILGDAVSAGASGLIDGSESVVTGSAYAHTLRDVDVGVDAYYVTQSNVEASGANCPNSHCHPNSPDQTASPLPISEEQIDEWEAEAQAGGSIGTQTYSSGSRTLGPVKIDGNLIMSGSAELILTGTVWVTGEVRLSNNAIVRLDSGLGAESGVLVAGIDESSSAGYIELSNGAQALGSGTSGSYLLLLSQREMGSTAIKIANSSSAAIFYAGEGQIELSNTAALKEITAYKLVLSNSASVTYESGLQNVNFSSGPGGSWVFSPGTYSSN